MSLYIILNDDWADYEKRKADRAERLLVNCEEDWELHYLIKKIRRHYPYLSTEEVKAAILDSCRQISKPRPRLLFLQAVLRKFGIV
jgi:hypothetical protein